MLSMKYTDKAATDSKNNVGYLNFYCYPTYLKLVVIFKQPGETSVKLCESLVKHFENQRRHLVAH